MSKKRKKSKVALLLVLAVAVVLVVIGTRFAVTEWQPTTNYFKQYAGNIGTNEDWNYRFWGGWKQDDIVSSTAILGEYKVETLRSNKQDVLVGCNPLSCSGTLSNSHLDEYRCETATCTYTQTTNYGTYSSKSKCRSDSPCEYDQCKPSGSKYVCILSTTVTTIVGGSETRSLKGCFSKHKIYKNDILIEETDWSRDRIDRFYEDYGLDMGLHIDSEYHDEECNYIENRYIYKIPSNSFDFDISTPETVYYKGEDVLINLKVINNYRPITGKLEVTAEIPYILFGNESTAKETQSQIIDIPLGETIFTYKIPTEQITDKLYITPKLDILMEGGQFDGVNINCDPDRTVEERDRTTGKNTHVEIDSIEEPAATCAYISIGVLQGSRFTVKVTTKEQELIEELLSKEQEIELLKASVGEKARIINELTQKANEQAEIVNSLELTISKQSELVKSLTNEADKQAEIISGLQLNLEEKAQLIASLQTESDKQAVMISELSTKVEDQAEIINNLNLNIDQQASLISDLTDKANKQALIIKNLKLNVDEQAQLINDLNLKVSDQAIIINELNLNLVEKVSMIEKLHVETDKQAELIKEMKLSFSDQAEIIDGLNLVVSEDAVLINRLTTNIEEQAEIISNLQITLDEKMQLIKQLTTNINEQAEIILNLQITLDEKIQLIKELTVNIDEQAEIIKNLKLSNEGQAEIIDGLKLKLEDEAKLINSLTTSLEEQAKIISNLKLTQTEKMKLIKELTDNIEEQQRLISLLQQGKKDMTIYYIIGGCVLFVITMLIIIKVKFGKKGRRRKR